VSTLTDNDLAELRDLARRYYAHRAAGHYAESDALRHELIEWGAYPPEQGWHPVFESTEHRVVRLKRRSTVIEKA